MKQPNETQVQSEQRDNSEGDELVVIKMSDILNSVLEEEQEEQYTVDTTEILSSVVNAALIDALYGIKN